MQRIAAAALIALFATACDDDGSVAGPEAEELLGEWQAVDFQFIDGNDQDDVLANGGYFNLLLDDFGEAYVEFLIPEPVAPNLYWSDAGTWEIDGSRVEVDDIDDEIIGPDDPFLYDDGILTIQFDIGDFDAIVVLERVGEAFTR